MLKSTSQKILFQIITSFSLVLSAEVSNLCTGKQKLLTLINRPTFSSSPCTVPTKNLLVEQGVQFQKLIGIGNQIIGPNLALRTGINNNTEVQVLPPTYYHGLAGSYSGYSPVWISLKKQLYQKTDALFSLEMFYSPPSGSYYAGSVGHEAEVDAIFFRTLTKKVSIQIQPSVSSWCDPASSGGGSYFSFNSVVLVNYNITKQLVSYIELQGETKTSYFKGSGLINGIGLIYLIRPTVTVDIEYYHRVFGQLNGSQDFIGMGFTKLLN
ncbi:MAG: transporter [Legionella sp.]|nr:transporter [Legionella sp.]